MKRQVWIGTLVLLVAAGQGLPADPPCCQQVGEGFLKRLGPAGGWHPYGGGLLYWWPRDCFPCAGTPDDYCRKPLPRFCWPPCAPYSKWGPPESTYPVRYLWPPNGSSH